MNKLPAGMRARRKVSGATYYYFDMGGKPRKEIPLGSNYIEAIVKISQLTMSKSNTTPTFLDAVDRYWKDVIPTKATRTQADNKTELKKLIEFFGNPPAPLDEIEPMHVRQFLDKRGKTAKVRANREKALFSAIFNHARSIGLTKATNPCAGVKGFSETGRTIYVTDEQFQDLWRVADWPVRDALDLAYLTGQRPADVLKMSRNDIRDGELWVIQNKTKAALRISIEGRLKEVIDRIVARDKTYKVVNLKLVRDESGKALGSFALRFRFDNARKLCGATWQIRDLRAKAGTDVADDRGILEARRQLGHKSVKMTENYIRAGNRVGPTK
jgi:integrase